MMTKVLVVDDQSISNIKQITKALANKGYMCKISDQEDDVVLEVRNFKPDLLFIPASEKGFKLCQKVKSDPVTCFVKVLMFVETENVNNVVEGFCLGVIDYIPIDTSEEDIIQHLEIKTAVESMYGELHSYEEKMQTVQRTNDIRLKRLNY
ncbi:hypothetical protein vBAmePPT11V19_00010 [Alteromonas phage vB_AmeP_PT11-V19]|nr:hypothetical protein vBAmePPT11V19_00010 [Alteromonas phage vB_AmeP_PT11-V19]